RLPWSIGWAGTAVASYPTHISLQPLAAPRLARSHLSCAGPLYRQLGSTAGNFDAPHVKIARSAPGQGALASRPLQAHDRAVAAGRYFRAAGFLGPTRHDCHRYAADRLYE